LPAGRRASTRRPWHTSSSPSLLGSPPQVLCAPTPPPHPEALGLSPHWLGVGAGIPLNPRVRRSPPPTPSRPRRRQLPPRAARAHGGGPIPGPLPLPHPGGGAPGGRLTRGRRGRSAKLAARICRPTTGRHRAQRLAGPPTRRPSQVVLQEDEYRRWIEALEGLLERYYKVSGLLF
jgi:hypothetical protein